VGRGLHQSAIRAPETSAPESALGELLPYISLAGFEQPDFALQTGEFTREVEMSGGRVVRVC
jgi:hypothetical protein